MRITYSKSLKAVINLWNRAEKNDAKSQYRLASFYLQLPSESAQKQAFHWYKKSAKKGVTDAMFALGRCYENGVGIRKSYFQAIQWYKVVDAGIFDDFTQKPDLSENQEDAAIQRYFHDEDWAQAIDEALENEECEDSFDFDKTAAERGDAEAQNRLGYRYYYGKDVEQDFQQALYWYKKSAEQGCETGIHRLAKYYEKEKNYKESAKWYRQYATLRIQWRNERLGW